MNWLKTTILIATTLVLLGIDALIGLSGTLYMPPIAGFGLVAFIVAIPLLIATGQGLVLCLQHNAALEYFLIQADRAGVRGGLMEFTGIAIGINVLLAVILWSRGRSVASPERGNGAAMCAVMAAFMSSAGPAIAHDSEDRRPDCLIHMPEQPSLARFADWPAAPGRSSPPAPPVLAGPVARRFRSVLREGAAAGSNFAGHFTIVVWGCGASCTSAAIVDARSGRVTMPPRLQAISAVHVADAADGFNSLRFRRGSRLLVALGAPGENERRDGATMLVWNGTALRMLRFVPRAGLCPA